MSLVWLGSSESSAVNVPSGLYRRASIESVPLGWGQIKRDPYHPIYYPPPASYCWQFIRSGIVLRTVWTPITVDGQMIVRPQVPGGWTRSFLLSVEPGCVVTTDEVSFTA